MSSISRNRDVALMRSPTVLASLIAGLRFTGLDDAACNELAIAAVEDFVRDGDSNSTSPYHEACKRIFSLPDNDCVPIVRLIVTLMTAVISVREARNAQD